MKGDAIKAAAAGAIGMTLVALARVVAGGERALSRGFFQPPPPAQASGALIRRITGRRTTRRHSAALNATFHALYAPLGGLAYEAARSRLRPTGSAAALFVGVWLTRLAALPGLGLRKPFWRYSPRENAVDAAYHLAYAAGVATSRRALRRLQ